MTVIQLKDCPQWIDTLADWLNEEFGTLHSRNFYQELLAHSLTEDRLPISFVAVENGVPVGTVGIWRGDLLSRQDLSPWLSALVVHPDNRGTGIGRTLQKHVLSYCKAQGWSEIYLYTDLHGYYEKSGWALLETGYEYSGTAVQIYRHTV